ncbi:MAG: carboxy terminal-processing peptidase [Gammaproteobacteria bacterium]|nr:carboxy terminal-processing peptidase [Gammaproteobacteria bacterium]
MAKLTPSSLKTILSTLRACVVVALMTTTCSVSAEIKQVAEADLTMNPELRKDIQRTVAYLRHDHYLPKDLDDDISERILTTYLERLDPIKLHFTQQDVDQLQLHGKKIDDYMKLADAEVAFDIYKLYRTRLEQSTELVMELLEQDFDFSEDESLNVDSDNYQWARSKLEVREKWRKRIKNDMLQQMLAETPLEEIKDNLARRYQRQRDVVFQLKADEVFEIFMNAYARELGPHTQYMSHITAENFRINMSLSLEGIGAALQTEEDYTVVNRIIPGGPAERSGAIKPEDKIVAVGQQGEEMINVIGWRLTDVVQMIRGDKGTRVRLQIMKADSAPGAPPEEIELVRDVIQLEDQAAKLSHVEIPDGNSNKKFSVISIPSFYSNSQLAKQGAEYKATAHDVRKLLKQVEQNQSDGLIIDLRGNGGGYLDQAVRLTGLFIPQGPVVQSVFSNRKREVRRDRDEGVAYDGPMIVLIDRYSASASEIFAAAMQDYGRALVVGERSFGKGTVQTVAPLRGRNEEGHESQVKFTIAQFFRVNGGSTQHRGVIPDIVVNSGIEDEEFGERAYDNALPWSQTRPVLFESNSFSPPMIEHLSKRHAERAQDSPAFTLLRQTSERRHANRNVKELSLVKDQRAAERKTVEAESLAQLNAYRASLGLDPVTEETRADNPLPDEDEHFNIVRHQEAARILLDQIKWTNAVITKSPAG